MKIEIEEADMREVIRVAGDYYGIMLTPAQALELIRESRHLQQELMDGGLDTVGRETLSASIVEGVMRGCPPPENKDKWGDREWHWPLCGSSDEYKEEFDRKFKAAALAKGLKLAACWDES